MRIQNRAHSGQAALALLVVIFTGCGDDGNSASTRGSLESPASDTEASETDSGVGPDGAVSDDGEPVVVAPGQDGGDGDGDGPTTEMPAEGAPLAMDECELDTEYAGDEYCILPPPPDKGFQLHIGPSNYEDPEPEFILQPGEELTTDFTAVSSNDRPVHFYYRQYRQRPGAHHNIITARDGNSSGLFSIGHRIGTTNLLAEDNPQGGVIPPENEGVGVPLEAHADISVSLHSINATDKPMLREIWVNFWYVDEDKVTQEAESLFALGDPTFAIPPGADTTLGPYSCDIEADGRLLWFYGHRHANNVRFSAWRVRDGQRDLFYEGLHWEEPLVLEYSSTVENTAPDRDRGIEGGWSGILDVQAGDKLEWECHVINQQSNTLRFTNNTFTGEMCIMDGEFVGTNCR